MFFLTLTLRANAQESSNGDPELRWWKGNLHTHSLWSDGDQFPEMIADWYRQRDYNFLALTDHNVLSEGMRWMEMSAIHKRADEGILGRYRKRFGDAWVETRGEPGQKNHEVRLKPMDEFRYLVEETGKFILIPAEEISDKAEGKPVHINATNLAEVIKPVGGDTVRQAIENNLRAILEHEKKHGREVLPHVNHPNFHYAITAEDLAAVVSERFFEVYNGHPGVNHLGDDDHPSIERMWDIANAIRQTSLDIPPLMGIGTDDSHEYHGKAGSRPGRGWVMVRSKYLTPEHLIRAMKQGDFYASSGVALSDVQFDKESQTLSLAIATEPDTTYETKFIATLKKGDGVDEHRIGAVVATSESATPEYKLTGNELYVRAVVTSSKPPVDPSFKDQKQQAWTQPVGWE
ncbi:PHP domain-containing protein [Novipirellula sp. SH528]|uniref:PHP domain-containing protein n=1 Tax=Novipirellula sp. SH528 TaxID=3454466 RepID=UPI003F9F306C